MVDYYGTMMAINQVANMNLDARTISVQPWERRWCRRSRRHPRVRSWASSADPGRHHPRARTRAWRRLARPGQGHRQEGEGAKVAVQSAPGREPKPQGSGQSQASEDDERRAQDRCRKSPIGASPKSTSNWRKEAEIMAV